MRYPAVLASVLCFLIISVVHADSVPKSVALLESMADAHILVEEAAREARRQERPANALGFSIASELRVERARGDLVLRRSSVPEAIGPQRNVAEERVSSNLLSDLRPVHVLVITADVGMDRITELSWYHGGRRLESEGGYHRINWVNRGRRFVNAEIMRRSTEYPLSMPPSHKASSGLRTPAPGFCITCR